MSVYIDYMSKKITIITGKRGCENETSVDSRNRRSKLKTQINTHVNTSPLTRKGKICKHVYLIPVNILLMFTYFMSFAYSRVFV